MSLKNKRMLIGIDGNEANINRRVGVNNYAYELLWNLYKLQDKGVNDNQFIVYLKNSPLPDMPKTRKGWVYKIIPGENFWILTKLSKYLNTTLPKPDLFFTPSHYTTPFLTIPRIVSIMDLGYLDFSGQFKKSTFWQLKYWTAISVFVSKYIIAISEDTKKEIVRHYPFASKKVFVTHLAYNKNLYKPDMSEKVVRRILKNHSIVDDYILFLSTLKPSKNLEGVVEAYKKLKNKEGFNVGIKLVIAGKKGWMYQQIYKKVEEAGLKQDVKFIGFVDEEEKPYLIKAAKLLISPSFTEGFGLHVLESMAVGTPVVVSKMGALGEIAGEAGIYINPYSSDSIEEGLIKVLKLNKKRYNELSKKCIKQAQKFSWEDTAIKTLEIFKMLKQ